MSVLTANQKIAVVGHLLRYPDGRIQHGGTHRVPGAIGFPHLDSTRITEPSEMEAVTAASMLVRKDAFNAVGGFDESYFMYLEDTDLCLKLRTAGYMVYYTPYAQGVHEGSASSKGRLDLKEIIAKSTSIFTAKWKGYFLDNPKTPTFDSFDKTAKTLNLEVVYVHVVGDAGSESSARRFVESALKYQPGAAVTWVIACNSPYGNQLSQTMQDVFSKLGKVVYFKHDNSGYDIGAFQAYSRQSQADILLFFGKTAYFRRHEWAFPVLNAFRTCGENAIYGTHGNMGDQRVNVSPHVRTTGFWLSPKVLNRYPITVKTPDMRYPFEHGPNGLTMWAWSQGMQVLVVDGDGIWQFPTWDDSTEGFHRGTQRALLFGDRLSEPPYYQVA
jgi:hypothetical protein